MLYSAIDNSSFSSGAEISDFSETDETVRISETLLKSVFNPAVGNSSVSICEELLTSLVNCVSWLVADGDGESSTEV